MTTPSAELMITPEVSRSAIMEMQRDFNRGFDKVGKDAEKTISNSVRDGVKSGVRRSKGLLGGLGGAVRGGVDRLGGARGMATGVLGIGLVGLINSIDRADEGSALIAQLLAENNSATQIATATNAGFDLDEFASFSRTLQRGGFREQQDINDVIFDIQERTADAKSGGNQVLAQFVGLEGRDLTNSVLASIGGLSGNDQAFALAELGFGGETGQNLLRVIQTASKNGTLSVDDTKTALDESNKSKGERIADNLTRQAEFSAEFQNKALDHADEQTTRLLDELNSGTIASYFEGLKPQDEKNVNLIKNFDENIIASNKAREKIELGLDTLNKTTLGVISAVESLTDRIVKEATSSHEELQADGLRGTEQSNNSYIRGTVPTTPMAPSVYGGYR